MKKTKKPASTAAPTETRVRCAGPCGRALLASRFTANAKLLGGLQPWCEACVRAMRKADGEDAALMRAEYHKAYLRSYQAARRAPMRVKVAVRCADEGWSLGLTRIVRTGRVRVCGPWRQLDVVGDIVRRTFRCDPASVAESGSGGGTGARRQRRVCAEGDLPEDGDAWERGLRMLRASYDVEEVKKLGRLGR